MNRLKEPSTWAGVAVLAQIAGSFMPPSWKWIADAISAGAASAAVGLKEKPNPNA